VVRSCTTPVLALGLGIVVSIIMSWLSYTPLNSLNLLSNLARIFNDPNTPIPCQVPTSDSSRDCTFSLQFSVALIAITTSTVFSIPFSTIAGYRVQSCSGPYSSLLLLASVITLSFTRAPRRYQTTRTVATAVIP